jgi:hypothetical protein
MLCEIADALNARRGDGAGVVRNDCEQRAREGLTTGGQEPIAAADQTLLHKTLHNRQQ